MKRAQQSAQVGEYPYDVGLSFAGEQRAYVEEVAAGLDRLGIGVFYDRYEQVDLWGKNLTTHLDDVYRKQCRYCVMFASADYARKVWTNAERASAQARAVQQKEEYLLPARFDDTEIPGLLPTVGYIDLRVTAPAELVQMITRKLDRLGDSPDDRAALGDAISARPVFPGRWRYSSVGDEAVPLRHIQNLAMPGIWGSADQLPFLRAGIAVACSPLAEGASSTECRSRFLEFLGAKPVTKVLSAVTADDRPMAWRRLSGHGTIRLEAVAGEVADRGPTASAMLLLPHQGATYSGHPGEAAVLWLQVIPRGVGGTSRPAAGLGDWYHRYCAVFSVAEAFAEFLPAALHLPTRPEPPVSVAFLLQGTQSLGELVDPGDIEVLDDGSLSRQFFGYAIASPTGRTTGETVRIALGQLCDYGLHLTGFEQVLTTFGQTSAGR